MMTADQIRIRREELLIVLHRAFAYRTVTIFGEDGCGHFGRHFFPMQFKIKSVMLVDYDSTTDFANVVLIMEDYSRFALGSASTDMNLQMSVNQHLTAVAVDTNCWQYGTIEPYDDGVVLRFDVQQVLQW